MEEFNFEQLKNIEVPQSCIEKALKIPAESKRSASPVRLYRFAAGIAACVVIAAAVTLSLMTGINKNVDIFVLGNPLNLDGSLSKRSEETLEFKSELESRFNKEVIMQDERLSTVEAERMLISNDTKRKNRKKVINKIAATIILQGYLDRKNNER